MPGAAARAAGGSSTPTSSRWCRNARSGSCADGVRPRHAARLRRRAPHAREPARRRAGRSRARARRRPAVAVAARATVDDGARSVVVRRTERVRLGAPRREAGDDAAIDAPGRRGDRGLGVHRGARAARTSGATRTSCSRHPGPEFAPPPPEADRRGARAYSLPEPFVLHVGNLEPRKDVPTLARAAAAAGVPLVLAGGHIVTVDAPAGAQLLGHVAADGSSRRSTRAATVVALRVALRRLRASADRGDGVRRDRDGDALSARSPTWPATASSSCPIGDADGAGRRDPRARERSRPGAPNAARPGLPRPAASRGPRPRAATVDVYRSLGVASGSVAR